MVWQLSNIKAPIEAIVGERVALSVDVNTGWAILGETFDLIWTGDAPGMPYSQTLTSGTGFGETKTVYYSFIMPDRVVHFRVQGGETGCLFCDEATTPDYTITPGTETFDPTEKPSNILDYITKLFGGIGGNLLWIILGLVMLLTIGYVVTKRRGKPGSTGTK